MQDSSSSQKNSFRLKANKKFRSTEKTHSMVLTHKISNYDLNIMMDGIKIKEVGTTL